MQEGDVGGFLHKEPGQSIHSTTGKAKIMCTDGFMWNLSIDYFYFHGQIASQIILRESEYGEGDISSLRKLGI